MKHQIIEALSKKLGDSFEVSIHGILKINQKLDGLTILKKGETISPAIYLESYYQDLEKGTSLDAVSDAILQFYFHAKRQSITFDLESMLDFSKVKEKLFVKLINKHTNMALLEKIPYMEFLDDFAITIHSLFDVSDAEERISSFLIQKNLLEKWNFDTKIIFNLAMQNTRKMFGVTIQNLSDTLLDLYESSAEKTPMELHTQVPMWVLTNHLKWNGASVILFEDILNKFAKEHGDFCIILSSIHEALLIPADSNTNIEELTQINREVNITQVSTEEVLGTKAYYYSRKNGFVF